MCELANATREELVAYLRWCDENDVVPMRRGIYGSPGNVESAGCGCCSDPVSIPAEFRRFHADWEAKR